MILQLLFFLKLKTAYDLRISDWSSDVCSSYLTGPARLVARYLAGAGSHCGGSGGDAATARPVRPLYSGPLEQPACPARSAIRLAGWLDLSVSAAVLRTAGQRPRRAGRSTAAAGAGR